MAIEEASVRLISEYGVLVVLAGATIALLYKYFDNMLDKEKLSVEKNLLNHNFFNHMEHWINIKIPTITIESKRKESVVRKFLKIKFTVFLEAMKNFCTAVSLDPKMSEAEFTRKLNAYTTEAINEYNKQAKALGVPEMFISKFCYWHNDHVKLFVTTTNNIAQSSFYSDNKGKTISILNIATAIFDLTIIDAEKTINSLNGELELLLQTGDYEHFEDIKYRSFQ